MFPIALDLSKIPVLLVGAGEAFVRRKVQLEGAGATKLICRESFNAYDLEVVSVVMVAGLAHGEAARVAHEAREAGRLVNVQDVNELCDFYYTAHIRRGDLLIAVSTNGASPTLAKRVRDRIATLFDDKWAGYTEAMKEFRLGLKAQGKSMKAVMAASEKFLDEKGWLKL